MVTAKWNQNKPWDFDYTGGEQTFIIPQTGFYKLEVWGAGGGNNTYNGYGGYAVGIYHTTNTSTKLFINTGGSPNENTGGYNGGGTADIFHKSAISNGGSGLTHIATVSGLLKNLSSYKDTGGTTISKEILIVAGGGGGGVSGTVKVRGGDGGGYVGNNGAGWSAGGIYGIGGTQTIAGSASTGTGEYSGAFGQGGSGCNEPAGGGGWYGGGGQCSSTGGTSGGGSGYIGSSNLISGGGITKHMTCYYCATSTADGTRTNSNTSVSATATADYSKIGNGYARITYLGTSI